MDSAPSSSQPQIRLLLVEDNRDWLSLLASILPTCCNRFTVTGAFHSPPTSAQLLDARPNVAILDILGCNGLEVARQLRDLFPACGIVFLTAYFLHPAVTDAIAKIPHACLVPKPVRIEDLTRAIIRLADQANPFPPLESGQAPLSRRIATPLAETEPPPGIPHDTWHRVARLTPKEWECAYLRAQGRSNAEIAAHLGVGEKRVRNLVTRLLRKTSCRSLADCVHLLHRTALLGQDGLPPLAD